MITKNKSQELVSHIYSDKYKEVIEHFKQAVLRANQPERIYKNLFKNYKIIANNYGFGNILYKEFAFFPDFNSDKRFSEWYAMTWNLGIQNLGIIGACYEKCKPYLVFAWKYLKFDEQTGKYLQSETQLYSFTLEDPKYIRQLIKEDRIRFKGD